jgi:hypothetical protein
MQNPVKKEEKLPLPIGLLVLGGIRWESSSACWRDRSRRRRPWRYGGGRGARNLAADGQQPSGNLD